MWIPLQPVAHAFSETDPLSIRVETPEYELTATGIDVPGYASNTIPGAPRLPVRGITFDLPVTGRWEMTFESVGSRLLDEHAAIPAVPVPNLDLNSSTSLEDLATLPSSVPVVDRPDQAIYSADAFYPASPVMAGEMIRQGDKRLLPVRVFPFQYNPVSHELRYHPDLRITVRLLDGQQSPEPDAAPPAVQPKRAIPAANVEAAARVYTRERGLYRLTYSELAAAGIPVGPSGRDPHRFVLYNDGQPVDIQLIGGGDNTFDPGDLIVFYAVPYTGRFQNYNVYTLAVTDQANTAVMGTRPVGPSSTFSSPSTITQTLHIEYDRDYRSLYERPMNVDHWFDTQLYANASTPTVTRVYDLNLDDPITTSGNVQMTALIHGGNSLATTPDQSVVIRLNTYSLGQFTWDGAVDHTMTARMPTSVFDSSPNRITLEAALAQLPGLTAYWISPDWIDLRYPAMAEAEQDRIYVEAMASSSPDVVINGFSAPDVKVYDVRQPGHPVQITGVSSQINGGSFTLGWSDSEPGRSYYLSTQDSLLAPSTVEADVLSQWATPNHQADYIAIVGAQRSFNGTTSLGGELSAAIEPLLNHRAAEGLEVVKVDVLDIYDEFSYGKVTPQAIRDFLTYAYWNWNNGGPRPHYVLLVGDGHYDFTGVSTQPLPNLLPPYLLHVDPWWGEVPVDNRFVSTDGQDDYVPNMAIGRIPANFASDVTAVVNKTLTYESETANPPGPWQERVLYVADDCNNSAGDFHSLSNYGRLQWLPSSYTNSRIYYDNPNDTVVCPDGTHTSSATIRPAVRAAFDRGAFFVHWFGHGSQTRWGSVIIHQTNDVLLLNTTTQHAVTMANACLTGYFVWHSPYPAYPGSQAMAEVMSISPNKSSIVDFSPSGLHVGSALLVLSQGMHRALFNSRIERAGDVTDAAKLYFYENSFAWHDVIDTMIVFGDPATKLRHPTGNLSTSSMEVSETTALPGATLQYTVTVTNSSIFTTTSPVVLVDYPEDMASVVNANGGANNGDTLSWTLPHMLPGASQVVAFALQADPSIPSTADLVVPAAISSQMAPTATLGVTTSIQVAPILNSAMDVTRAWMAPGQPITTTLDLINTGTTPIAGVQVTLTLPGEIAAPTSLSASNSTPVYDPAHHWITWIGNANPGHTLITAGSTILPTISACGQFTVSAEVVNPVGPTTLVSTTVNLAVPDVDCNGDVDIADIQQVAARWLLATGDPGYHPRYDLNADDVIDVLDVIIDANAWD